MFRKSICKDCGRPFTGRSDKMFCDHTCRSNFHNRINRDISSLMRKTEKMMRRNRKILENLYQQDSLYVPKKHLERLGFNFQFLTELYHDEQGKTYHCVYEFRYHFINQDMVQILLVRPIL